MSAPSLDEICDLFYTAASRFHKEHGNIPAVVIDNANRLTLKHVELLEQLQYHAKWACRLFLFQVKDSSPNKSWVSFHFHLSIFCLIGISGRSAWSRHGEILEVGDLTKTESLNNLHSQNVDEATAEEIYSLVGGRIILLRLLLGALRVKTFE